MNSDVVREVQRMKQLCVYVCVRVCVRVGRGVCMHVGRGVEVGVTLDAKDNATLVSFSTCMLQ